MSEDLRAALTKSVGLYHLDQAGMAADPRVCALCFETPEDCAAFMRVATCLPDPPPHVKGESE